MKVNYWLDVEPVNNFQSLCDLSSQDFLVRDLSLWSLVNDKSACIGDELNWQ